MNGRQKIALCMPPIIVLSMVGVFQAALLVLKDRQTAWYVGFLFYWPVWGVLYPLFLIGKENVFSLFRNRLPKGWEWILFSLPPTTVLLGTMVIRYDPSDLSTKIILVITSFLTGTLEEILWRGLFVSLFPRQLVKGYIWPALWFALWHFAPGTVSNVPVFSLMAGALVLGLCWGLLAYRTETIRWTALSHILTGVFRSII